MGERNRVVVKIASTEYVISGEESPDYIQRVAGHVDRKVREIMKADPSLSITQTAMLAALNLCDEALRKHHEVQAHLRKVTELEKRLASASEEGDALRQEIHAARDSLSRLKQELIRVENENRALRSQRDGGENHG